MGEYSQGPVIPPRACFELVKYMGFGIKSNNIFDNNNDLGENHRVPGDLLAYTCFEHVKLPCFLLSKLQPGALVMGI